MGWTVLLDTMVPPAVGPVNETGVRLAPHALLLLEAVVGPD